MVYLIGWESNLDSSGSHWKQMAASLSNWFPKQTVPRQLILDGHAKWDFSFHAYNFPTLTTDSIMERATTNNISQNIFSTAVSIRNYIRSLLGLSNEEESYRLCDIDWSHQRQSLSDVSQTDHHAMSMVGAFLLLQEKRNLKIIDRLSILANLARYEYHLDIDAILENEPNISYSACILALAFTNGDLSLLTDTGFFNPADPQNLEPSWLMPNTWLVQSQNRLEIMPRHTFAGKITSIGNPCVVVDNKLFTRGVLWKIENHESLLPLQKGIRSCLDSCRGNKASSRSAGLQVLKATVKQLFASGNESLVPLVVILARKSKWESPAEIRSTMQQLQNWHQKGGSWPPQIHPAYGFLSSGDPQEEDSVEYDQQLFNIDALEDAEFRQDSIPSEYKRHNELIPEEWGISLLRWIYLTIYFGVPLAVGRYQIQHEGKDDEYAIFNLNPNDSEMVFVPLGELNYEFNRGIHFEVSSVKNLFWRVRERHEPIGPTEEARQRLNELDQDNPLFADGALSIELSEDLEGCWSPMLYSKGVLEWDNESRSYRKITPTDFAPYHTII
ncbi:hypothetical protein M434DRAFT_276872 [Hypoxylon sp. CO27-5]|nr:hypothetical protein M434DRAFT_276872 [Hypoxylon sp. CO27-5]